MSKWVQTLEKVGSKNMLRIYRIDGNVAFHRGESVSADTLYTRSLQMTEASSPLELIGRLYVLCFKSPVESRQRRFEIKRIPLSGAFFADGIDLESGEMTTLKGFMSDNNYTEDDIVSVLTRPENNVIRSFQRRNK